MQILDVANLKSGRSFSQPLFHSSGRKLLSAKAVLTQEHIDAMARSGIKQVFMAESARPVVEFGSKTATMVAVASLVLNSVAETDLLSPDGVVVIQQNEQVEEHHLVALRDSQIEFLIARPAADIDSVRGSLDVLSHVVVARMQNLIDRGEFTRAPESRAAFINGIRIPPSVEPLDINVLQAFRKKLALKLQPVFGMLETGNQPSLRVLQEITDELLKFMRSEPRQFPQLALMTVRREDHLPDHAISVAVLSMAIATQMKLALDTIREVVMGALLCDVGMLAIPKRIRASSSQLTHGERQRMQQHPIYSLTMLELVPGLSPIARLMALQHHERLNGGGYPQSALGPAISDYARIAAVADIFAASTNPRAYKSQKLPYMSVEELVLMAHKGILDTRVVKAFLAAIGIFPVSSFVILSDNTAAQIVGTNAKIDRPLVRPVPSGGSVKALPILDLSAPQHAHLKIVRAIPDPSKSPEAPVSSGGDTPVPEGAALPASAVPA
jgi:HD-GYP domain-containing protein (c-di-GMP phosphodiesterase class II)